MIHKNRSVFLQFSLPRVHENSQKSGIPFFFNFHDPGYMKIHKNQALCFSSIFMTPGTWKFTKIERFIFLQFSWPRVHEKSQKSDVSFFYNFHDPGYVKIQKNQTLNLEKTMHFIVFSFFKVSYTCGLFSILCTRSLAYMLY